MGSGLLTTATANDLLFMGAGGNYSATASLGSGTWLLQLAAFAPVG